MLVDAKWHARARVLICAYIVASPRSLQLVIRERMSRVAEKQGCNVRRKDKKTLLSRANKGSPPNQTPQHGHWCKRSPGAVEIVVHSLFPDAHTEQKRERGVLSHRVTNNTCRLPVHGAQAYCEHRQRKAKPHSSTRRHSGWC